MSKKRITPSALRQNIYQILDEVILSGEAVEIKRDGHVLRLEPPKKRLLRDLTKLTQRPGLIIGDPDDLVNIDWSKKWRP